MSVKREDVLKYLEEANMIEISELVKDIEDKFISGSDSVELNVDYSRYGEFVNFSSAQKRLENFKYKLQ